MGFIDMFFYIAGIIAVAVIAFKTAKRLVVYIFDNWIPFVRVTVSHIDESGVKRSKAVWLDKRIPEDADLIKTIDSVKSET
jgi:hypothetical protein